MTVRPGPAAQTRRCLRRGGGGVGSWCNGSGAFTPASDNGGAPGRSGARHGKREAAECQRRALGCTERGSLKNFGDGLVDGSLYSGLGPASGVRACAGLLGPRAPVGRAVLNGEKKKCFVTQFPQKSPRAHHLLAVGGGWLMVGDWLLVAVGGGSRGLVVGDWWLMAVGGGWRLVVGHRWRLAVDGPLGRSLRAVLNKKKTSPLRDPPAYCIASWGSSAPELQAQCRPFGRGGGWRGGRRCRKAVAPPPPQGVPVHPRALFARHAPTGRRPSARNTSVRCGWSSGQGPGG